MVFNARFVYRCTALALLGLACLLLDDAKAVTIAWSPVGNAGNAADPATGFGAVGYDYQIGTYDVTNAQYTEFLNAKDPTGSNTLKLYDAVGRSFDANRFGISFAAGASVGNKYTVIPGYAQQPVIMVNWFDAIRFSNWLNNGQGTGDTETGAYTLLGGTPTPSNANGITRGATAHIALPSENEWYKAAYYDSTTQSYFQYPTASSTLPANGSPPGGPNSANYNGSGLTDVGAYTLSLSPYDTFDQGGNVYQWIESLFNADGRRVARGGSWTASGSQLASTVRAGVLPLSTQNIIGFRVATVPEPSTGFLALVAGTILLWWRRCQ